MSTERPVSRPDPTVDTFFYGSYINPKVLAEVGLDPSDARVASLAGYDLRIAPRANLVPDPASAAYGIVVGFTHAELERLYAHARDVLGETYLPYPVVTRSDDGDVPALCYIADDMAPAPADEAYVRRILDPARALGFPEHYLAKIESFLP